MMVWFNFLLSCAANLSSAVNDGGLVINDAFSGGAPSAIWSLGKSEPRVTTEGLLLSSSPDAKGFVAMRTRPGVLPRDINWAMTLDSEFVLQGQYGTSIQLMTDDGKCLFRILDDAQGLKLWMGDATVSVKSTEGWKGYPGQFDLGSQFPHRVRYAVSNRHGELRLEVDGTLLARVYCDRPLSLAVGNATPQVNAGLWSNILLHRFNISYDGLTPDMLPKVLEPLVALHKETVSDADLKGIGGPSVARAKLSQARLPIAARSLSRSNFGALESCSESRFSTNELGELVLRGGKVEVAARPGQTIRFVPAGLASMSEQEFVGLQVNTVIRTTLRVQGKSEVPGFNYTAPTLDASYDRVLVIAADVLHNQSVLQRAEVRVSSHLPDLTAQVNDAPCGSHVALVADTNLRWLIFSNGAILGRLPTGKPLEIDTSNLLPGTYKLSAVAVDAGGSVEPPITFSVEVGPRFHLESDASAGAVPISPKRTGVKVKATPVDGSNIAKTQVFLNGVLAAESAAPEFDQVIDMTDQDTGKYDIQVCGVLKDGSAVAPEHLAISITNQARDDLHAAEFKRKQLEDKANQLLSAIHSNEADSKYWYEKACNEPEFRTFISGTTISLLSIDEFGRVSAAFFDQFSSITVPGHAADYLAKSKAAFLLSAGHRLDLGRVQKQVGWLGMANDSFNQVIKECGAESELGSEAESELKNLKN